jgi:hypothetical protein
VSFQLQSLQSLIASLQNYSPRAESTTIPLFALLLPLLDGDEMRATVRGVIASIMSQTEAHLVLTLPETSRRSFDATPPTLKSILSASLSRANR